MKRTLLLAALFLLLGSGAWYALRQKKAQTGSLNSWDMEFAIKNPAEVSKIFIADRKGQTATLERKDGQWIYNGQHKARPTAIQTLLTTLTQVNVWFVPPKAAEAAMIKSLATEGIKVEIYGQEGKKIKSYYVGGVTNDERGTYMIMEGAEQPYVTHIPSFVGQLRVRYMLGDDQWCDRSVFAEKPETIQSISVEYPQQKSESFRLEKVNEASYTVRPFFSTTTVSAKPQRKGLAEAYLLSFESLVSEGFETDNPLRDSVTALVPFAIVKVKHSSGEEATARFWPVEVNTDRHTGKTYVERYFTEKNGADFLLTQHRVFSPIFRGYHFFFEGGEVLKN